MKELGRNMNVPVIDLNRKSIAYYNAIGVEATKQVFMFLKPGESPNYPDGVEERVLGRHAFTQIKTGMRRLVVADVLPGDSKAVDSIMHQRVHAMICHISRRVNYRRLARRSDMAHR